jgi:ribosomal protein S18 acetylase RimI-like enzyme
MIIRIANQDSFYNVMTFYYDLIDSMKNAEFHPGWEKDVYPARKFIQESIEQGELSIAIIDNKIVGAMVMNHNCADGYNNVHWKIKANKNDVIVIHALGISLKHQGQGIAKKMVTYAIDTCKEKSIKAIRLDVLASNKPAQKLYTLMGFVYIDTIQLFYEDTGLTYFLLYERAI